MLSRRPTSRSCGNRNWEIFIQPSYCSVLWIQPQPVNGFRIIFLCYNISSCQVGYYDFPTFLKIVKMRLRSFFFSYEGTHRIRINLDLLPKDWRLLIIYWAVCRVLIYCAYLAHFCPHSQSSEIISPLPLQPIQIHSVAVMSVICTIYLKARIHHSSDLIQL